MSNVMNIFKDEALETAARDAIRLDESQALLEKFVTLVRESGTPDEEAAGRYIVDRLKALGVPVTLHTPELYISNPVRAELTISSGSGSATGAGTDDQCATGATRTLHARPPAMGRSTGDAAVEGEICYVPSKYAGGTSSLFDLPDAARGGGADDPVRGRIVLTEGFSMPASVGAFERRGAIGADLHPPRQERARGHLHLDLGRAHR